MSVSIQKADLWKRISAYMFDILLVSVITIACTLLFMTVFKYDSHFAVLEERRAYYETQFEIDLDITEEEYNDFTESQKNAYNEAYQQANDALSKDETVMSTYTTLITLSVASVSLGLLIGNTIVYLLVPLLFKNGQSLGKKIFGLAVVRSNSVKLSTPILFIRCMIGQFAIETMFPMFLIAMILVGWLGMVGVVTIALFLILQVGVMISSPTNSTIHDLLSDTVVVDMASQTIFESQGEFIEYQKAEAERKANEARYM